MGAKITIDSATLANKALEIIEAHFLYGIAYERLDAIVHPQSVIHSLVEFVDGSVLAQLGFPTMELPILYALTYPNRIEDAALQTYDPVRSSPLTFEPIDDAAFPLFEVGVRAGRTEDVCQQCTMQRMKSRFRPFSKVPSASQRWRIWFRKR